MPKSKKHKNRRIKEKKLRHKKRRKLLARESPRKEDSTKLKYFQITSPFPPEMPREERLNVLREIGKQASEAIDRELPLLSKWFVEFDAVYLLSYLAFYHVAQPEGRDAELVEERPFFHHYIEILQAFALRQQRSHKVQPLLERAGELLEKVKQIGELLQLKHFEIPPDLAMDEDLVAHQLRTSMMSQTTAMRNWAYLHQQKRVVLDLASRVRKEFLQRHDIDPVSMFEMLFSLIHDVEDKLNAHRSKVQSAISGKTPAEIVDSYNVAFPENVPVDDEGAKEIGDRSGKDLNVLRAMLICHADLRLDDVYSFSRRCDGEDAGRDARRVASRCPQ